MSITFYSLGLTARKCNTRLLGDTPIVTMVVENRKYVQIIKAGTHWSI